MLTRAQIDAALPNVADGVQRYCRLQTLIHAPGFSADPQFRKAYCYFYGITPHRDRHWQDHYFNLLIAATQTVPTFAIALRELQHRTGRVESSFSSKLVASVDPDRPVIDKYVLLNTGLRLPSAAAQNRLADIATLYAGLDRRMHAFLNTDDGRYLVEQFTSLYSTAHISEIKMLDFALWQSRSH